MHEFYGLGEQEIEIVEEIVREKMTLIEWGRIAREQWFEMEFHLQ